MGNFTGFAMTGGNIRRHQREQLDCQVDIYAVTSSAMDAAPDPLGDLLAGLETHFRFLRIQHAPPPVVSGWPANRQAGSSKTSAAARPLPRRPAFH
jgi:hypothetical protein